MATTLTRDGTSEDKIFLSFPISKFEATDDGNLMVYGKATDGSVDSDEQIVDPDWSGPALHKWLETGGNVRVQHNPSLYPAGKGLSVEETPDGHFVKALVVEPTAQRLVKAGVLQAYSVGISRPVVERDITGKARGGIIRGGEMFEISLVDRPANKNCGITLSKSQSDIGKSENDDQWSFGDLEGQLAQSDISKAAGPETASQWSAARLQWLAAEPDPATSTQGPEYLAKRAEWQQWHADGEAAGLESGGFNLWLSKRQQDPSVGGGVDRDKIPASDFAGKDRSFPIVKPGDVSDAASSIGRAGPDNFPAEKLKANIIRIAKRKGPEFVAELPESWTKAAKKSSKAEAAAEDKPGNRRLLNPKPGKKPSFVIGANLGGDQTAQIPIYHKDDDSDSCPTCGHDMADGVCSCCGQTECTCGMAGDGGEESEKDYYMADDGQGAITKCLCGSCGHQGTEGDRFCAQCGSPLEDGGEPQEEDKSLFPTRGAKEDNGGPVVAPGARPAGQHREPDGDTSVERLEGDAGLDTDPDEEPDRVPASVDAKQASYSVKRMHDALCAAYHQDAVLATYPALKSVGDAIDMSYFQTAIADATVKSDFQSLAALGQLAGDALGLQTVDAAKLADAHAEVHKSFTDMYPDTKLSPSAPPKPGSFTRPYISTGHAPMTATGRRSKMPPGGREVNPDDFNRGPLTAGHESPSPANKGGNNPLDTTATGSARALYAVASREYVANRMKSIHDHIEMTTTGICPMAPSTSVLPPDNNAGARPAPRPPLNTGAGAAPSTKAVKATPGLDLEAVQKLIDESVATATKSMKKKHKAQLVALKAELDELGRQPDPTQAPVRGVVRKSASGEASPVEKRHLAIEAQALAAQKAEKAEYVNYLQNLTKSGDPDIREKAYKALTSEGVLDPFAS